MHSNIKVEFTIRFHYPSYTACFHSPYLSCVLMSSFNHHFAPPTERVDTYPVVPARLIILLFMEKKKTKSIPV